MDSLAKLLPLMHILPEVWDKDRFGQTKQRAADDEDVHGSSTIKVDVVDATIRSRLFWSYGIVVDIIGEVIQEVVAWAESCDCHFLEPTLTCPTRHFRRKRFRDRSAFQDTCQLSGKMAFCCAAGDSVRLFHTLTATAHSQLLSEPFFGGLAAIVIRDASMVIGASQGTEAVLPTAAGTYIYILLLKATSPNEALALTVS